jgi:hypothetical protein
VSDSLITVFRFDLLVLIRDFPFLQPKMHLRTLMLALAVAASAFPFASVNSEASSATVDIAKRIDEAPKAIGITEYEDRGELFERENDAGASIDIAKRN